MDNYAVSQDDFDKIEKAFTYKSPKGNQPDRYVLIRSSAKSLAVMLTENCPSSQELSLALTKLEECVMWANAAIARNEYYG